MADRPSDHEFRGQDSMAEGHSRMMQPFEQHLHTGFADLFLVDPHGRKRRGHQNGHLTVVETHQSDILPHLHGVPLPGSPKPGSSFVVARNGSSGSWPSGQESPEAPFTQ